ncbi:radical SAM protein [Youngiibacter multivorans]|uniref:Radical SAM protein with 4Fe4S-binding SPASM domain n=1 Tax=Youngiibacter multivorans TaxID=937251 RepID=A0ABS4G4F6_9CLOT|nr:radical SAM protein [Youngiibacter multivorans]MBP1919437.1 radical SAM protein with 4Fe4S-binding SPASM domain [Youngiibacter multivorans]
MSKFNAVTLEITKKCNHNCLFCYNISSPNTENVSFEQINFIVNKLVKYGIERVTVTGGEPYLVRNQTEYLIKELLDRNIDVCVNSNLTLLDEKSVVFLENTIGHNNIVYSSIPSVSPNKCDYITQSNGSFQRIVEGLKLCRDHNIMIGLNMSVSHININDLDYVESFLENNPVSSFTLFPVIPPVYDRTNLIHKTDNLSLIKVADTLVRIHDRFEITVGSIRPLPRCIIGDSKKYDVIRGSRCTTGQNRFSIDMVTGKIEACSQQKITYGNIYDDELETCYSRMQEWRDGLFLANVCRDCQDLKYCGGMCHWSEPCGRC